MFWIIIFFGIMIIWNFWKEFDIQLLNKEIKRLDFINDDVMKMINTLEKNVYSKEEKNG